MSAGDSATGVGLELTAQDGEAGAAVTTKSQMTAMRAAHRRGSGSQRSDSGGSVSKQSATATGEDREEKEALRLSHSDQKFHSHQKCTYNIFVLLCVFSVVMSVLLLLGTIWQRAQFDKLLVDFEVMDEVSNYGQASQLLQRAGHVRMYTSRNDAFDVLDNAAMQLTANTELYIEQTKTLKKHTTSLQDYLQGDYSQQFKNQVQAAMTAVDTLERDMEDIWRMAQTDVQQAVDHAETDEFRARALGVSTYTEAALDGIRLEAKDRRDLALMINLISFVATIAMLGIVTIGFALLAYRLLAARRLNADVLHALKQCQQYEDEKMTRTRGRNSVSMSSLSDSSASEALVPKRSRAAEKMKKSALIMKIVFTVFVVVSIAVYSTLLVSVVLVGDAIVAHDSFDVKSAWLEAPAHFSRVTTVTWLGMYSTFPFPALDWMQQNVIRFGDTQNLMAQLSCGGLSPDAMAEVFAVNTQLAGAAAVPVLLELGAVFDQETQDRLSSLTNTSCLTSTINDGALCYFGDLPETFVTTSNDALAASTDAFVMEFLAVSMASAPVLVDPPNKSDVPRNLLVDYDAAPDLLDCYPCEEFFERQSYCTDELLEYMIQNATLTPAVATGMGRAVMVHDVLTGKNKVADQLRVDFLNELNALNDDQISEAEVWNFVSILVVAISVFIVVVSCLLIVFEEKRRSKNEAVVRKEKEWTMYRLLHNKATADLFQEYSAVQFAEENVIFWRQCESVRREKWVLYMALDLYQKFIKTGAENEINIKNKRRKPIEEFMDEYASHSTPDRDAQLSRGERKLLLGAQEDIFDLMALNMHAGFILWPKFQQWEAERQKLLQKKLDIMMRMGGNVADLDEE